jgi:hypothetical protein
MRATRRFVLAAAALGLAVGTARAGVIINVDEVGNDVVATGSGSIDLTGLTFAGTFSGSATGTQPNIANITVGPNGSISADGYLGATGPTSFGTGGGVASSFGSGDLLGVQGNVGGIFVPVGYHSGDPLSATDTYSGQTFASLGLTPGTYKYTWGTGVHADFLTVQIGPAVAAVPEPSTLAGAAVGIALALGWAWRRRRASLAA